MRGTEMDTIDELRHRLDIQKVMTRYARGVDRLDWDLVRDCFHPDAIDEHADTVGSIEDVIDVTARRHQRIPFSVHFLGNCTIEFASPSVAVVETYFITFQRISAGRTTGETDLDVFGRYVDRFEQRDSVWRIARRKVVFDSMRARPAETAELKPSWIIGQRDGSDAIYDALRAVGLA